MAKKTKKIRRNLHRKHRRLRNQLPRDSLRRLRNEATLFRFFAGPATAVSLALRSHLAVMLGAMYAGRGAASLASEGRSGISGAGLLEQIVRQGQGSSQQFPASGCTVLWQLGSSGENPIGL